MRLALDTLRAISLESPYMVRDRRPLLSPVAEQLWHMTSTTKQKVVPRELRSWKSLEEGFLNHAVDSHQRAAVRRARYPLADVTLSRGGRLKDT